MLSDAQIERYARQIVLPEIGGRGQERLLAARVGILADSSAETARDTAILCALHLGAAGIGGLRVDDECRRDVTAAIEARSPDVRLLTAADPVEATAALGDRAVLARGRPTVFAGTDGARAIVALPRGLCAACLVASFPALDTPREWSPTLAPLLAPLAATLLLRELLSLGEREAPILVTVGVEHAGASTTTLRARAGCPDCTA